MKPHLILLPGLLCDEAVWAPLLKDLNSVTQSHIPDYGSADSLTAMAEGVLRNAPERFSVAGHSMGGRVAMEIMRLAPQRVERLALMDTGFEARRPGADGEAEAAKRHALLDIARSEGMRAMGERWASGMVHPERLQDAALMGDILDMIERKSPDIFAAQIRALLARPDATPVLTSLATRDTLAQPVLLMCGRQDSWSPPAQHEAMLRLAPQADLVIIEDSGHMSTMERPAAVAQTMLAWLAGQRGASSV
jgi:pimeloyl-ACP methyl ester carboxylesterase